MSVYRREDRGNHWWYRRTVRRPDGTRVRIQGKPAVNTKGAAEAAERAHVERTLNPPPPEPEAAPLFRDFAEGTFVPECRRDWKYSERLTTKSILSVHLLPRLGERRLDEIKTGTVDELRGALHKHGLGNKSVHNVLSLLRRILRFAHRRELIDRVPHFEMPKAVRQARRESLDLGIRREEFLTFDELERLCDCAEDPMLRAMILTGARLGLRSGEIRALQWGDIDRRRGHVEITRAEYRGVIGSPKSGSGRRIPLPSRVLEALGQLQQGIASALVFSTDGRMFREVEMTTRLIAAGCAAELPTAGKRRRRRNDHQRAYRLRRLERPLTSDEERWLAAYEHEPRERFGWHTLRHTFCTHLAMTGTPVVKIQRWAGHADIRTTQRYMHWAPAADDARHIDALDNPSAPVVQLVERAPNVDPARRRNQ